MEPKGHQNGKLFPSQFQLQMDLPCDHSFPDDLIQWAKATINIAQRSFHIFLSTAISQTNPCCTFVLQDPHIYFRTTLAPRNSNPISFLHCVHWYRCLSGATIPNEVFSFNLDISTNPTGTLNRFCGTPELFGNSFANCPKIPDDWTSGSYWNSGGSCKVTGLLMLTRRTSRRFSTLPSFALERVLCGWAMLSAILPMVDLDLKVLGLSSPRVGELETILKVIGAFDWKVRDLPSSVFVVLDCWIIVVGVVCASS